VGQRLTDIASLQSDMLDSSADPAAALQRVAARVQVISGADGVIIEVGEGGVVVFRVAAGTASRRSGLRPKQAGDLSERAVSGGSPQVRTDTEVARRLDSEVYRRLGRRSTLCAPLHESGRTIGLLTVISTRVARFAEDDVAVVRLLAGMIASALTRAQLAGELREAKARLRRLVAATTDNMGQATENEHGFQSLRVENRQPT
jgi:GAF domain-containing protein